MERRPAFREDMPVIPLPSSVMLADDDDGIKVAHHPVCLSTEKTVTVFRPIVGDNIHLVLADIIPTEILRRADPLNICITHIDVQFIVSKPARNELVTLTLLTTSAAPAATIWPALVAAPGPLYRFPLLRVQRAPPNEHDPFLVNITRTSSAPEVRN